jgi:hypothetical protein
LDLCCGKGGDIPTKWKKAKPAHYVGVDLSEQSVIEARKRFISKLVDEVPPRDAPPGIFIVADCGDEKNLLTDILAKEPSLKTLRSKIVFDVVST